MKSKSLERCIGIDICNARLDVADDANSLPWSGANNDAGIGSLGKRLQTLQPTLIVMEATGGLETLLYATFTTAGLPAVVMNPRQVRDFAKALGTLAQTDALDARILARFGAAIQPAVRPMKDDTTQELTALVTRRRQLLAMSTAEKPRLLQAAKWIRKDINAHIASLETRLKTIDDHIAAIIQKTPGWKEKDSLSRRVPGVGTVLSMNRLSSLTELGRLNRREIATRVGVAPLNRDRGNYRGKRRGWGGRAQVRAALSRAALSASRFNPGIKPVYQRLIVQRPPPKVALTACMRKLLVILNTMVKTQTVWNPNQFSTLDFNHGC